MDKNRRKFIKVMLIGGASFITGKILAPLLSKSLNNLDSPRAQNDPVTFKIVENKKTLSVYDNSGEEIFQIDNNA